MMKRSVLLSLPTCFLSLVVVSSFVGDAIEKLQRDFLWGKGREEVGLHLVAWEDICRSKWNGALGLKRFRKLIKLSSLNGFGALGMKVKAYGYKALLVNMVWKILGKQRCLNLLMRLDVGRESCK